MPDVIVSSILIRLRHPVHESGQTNVFDATTQEWVVDADGVPTALPEKGPFTPQQLEAKGLGLPVIMNQALQTAVSDRVAAIATALNATEARDKAIMERDSVRAELALARARIAELEAAAGLSANVSEAVSEKTAAAKSR